jgi:c-di-GMP-binding flagellar brake protein YcgR
MAEKRRSPRYQVRDVEGTLLFNIEAKIYNLSLTGMAVETGSALRIGSALAFTLRHGNDSLRLTGSVAWCRLARTHKASGGDTVPVYEAGVKFEGMLSDLAGHLLHFLEDSAIISLETRIAGRFKVSSGQAVSIESSVEFLVTELSASGMQIESGIVPEIDSNIVLDFRLPRGEIRAQCRVASIRVPETGGSRAVYRIGLEFQTLADAHHRILEAFIAEELHAGGPPPAAG